MPGTEWSSKLLCFSRHPSGRVRFGQTLQPGCAVRGYGNEVPCCCRISSMSDFVMRPSAFTSLRKFP
jgi:hypothetical protein